MPKTKNTTKAKKTITGSVVAQSGSGQATVNLVISNLTLRVDAQRKSTKKAAVSSQRKRGKLGFTTTTG